MQDEQLIRASLGGDKAALEQLIERHQPWLYNVAINLCGNTTDAADLTQEALIRIITKLSSFEYKSAFRTWCYRIVRNVFLNSKRSRSHQQTIAWSDFGDGLDQMPDTDPPEQARDALVHEAKLSCMKGMLLCLDPEQRMIYVLGELFEVGDRAGAEIMELSRDNFRQKLSRARKQLYGFMQHKCGLINKSNPCRCARKTRAFIDKGYVDSHHLQFQQHVLGRIDSVAETKLSSFEEEGYTAYRALYLAHPFQESPEQVTALKTLLDSKPLRSVFELGEGGQQE